MTTDPPGNHEPEVEIICQYCGYHLVRSAERLRRDIPMVCPNCGKEIVGPEDNNGTWS